MYSSKSLMSVAILLAFGTIAVSARDCPKVCTLEFNQVCATNGMEYRLFDNPCMMDAFNCEHEFLWTLSKSLERCVAALQKGEFNQNNDCYKPCTMEYIPVCGYNGERYQIFGNQCDMNNAHCSDGKEWFVSNFVNCEAVAPKQNAQINIDDCVRPCGVEYVPICAFDGKNYQFFDNMCDMHNAECGTNKHFMPAPFTACVANKLTNIIGENCEKACTMEYAPVCGFNGEEHKTFENRCIMENEHCRDHKIWKETLMTECEQEPETPVKVECEKPCTFEYVPVCGSNGFTHEVFPNLCALENAHCKDGKKWIPTPFTECIEFASVDERKTRTNCEKPCNRMYEPVCGSDGEKTKIFGNKCMLGNEHCKDGHNWNTAPMSACVARGPLSTILNNKKSNCLKPCNKMLAPICATDGQQYKIFSNKCIMENEHCYDNHEWKMTNFALCETKPQEKREKECIVICPRIYAPVCGSDGQTYQIFDNYCLLEKQHQCDGHQWKEITFSLCENPIPLAVATPKKDCPMICPMNYLPICAFNGKTHQIFSNDCELEQVNCVNDENFVATLMNECNTESNDAMEEVVACPDNYDPQCGFDGFNNYKIFENQCMFDAYNRAHKTKHFSLVEMSKCNTLSNEEIIACPDNYDPQCGFDGFNNYKVFENQCMFDAYNRAHKTQHFSLVEMSKCNTASNEEIIACPDNYDPQCGFDGFNNYKVFENQCMFDAYNRGHQTQHFSLVEMSKCNTVSNEEIIACPDNYDPQCGFDGFNYKVFENQCILDAYNRGKNQHFSSVEMSLCKLLL